MKPFGKGSDDDPAQCKSYMIMTKSKKSCSAIVRLNQVGDAALNILRYDQSVDENNQRILTFAEDFASLPSHEKKSKKVTDMLFVGNEHNKVSSDNSVFKDEKLRPVGFFRKIPKGNK